MKHVMRTVTYIIKIFTPVKINPVNRGPEKCTDYKPIRKNSRALIKGEQYNLFCTYQRKHAEPVMRGNNCRSRMWRFAHHINNPHILGYLGILEYAPKKYFSEIWKIPCKFTL